MIVQFSDGTTKDIQEYNLKRLFHRIPSLGMDHMFEPVEGRGDLVAGTQYKQRVITVTLLYIVQDICGYDLLRDELNALFTRDEAFYITFKREHWKRYKVRLAQQLEIDPNRHMNSFDITFRMDDLFAESFGTSLDLQNRGEWDEDIWGFGSGINYDTQYSYTFNTNSFVVKNIGNQTIDPRKSSLEITLKGTFNSFVQIKNNTTGDVYRFNNALSSTDTLKLSGIRTLKNSLSAFKHTNHKLLTLAPGDNNITVEGGTVNSVVFDFRFLYK
ncbi:phage tail family protein [Lysinibacillus pakistanensis]|uniref:Phage tail family protein n=1 Tax=Lysinibacillus pakistanensis TaxID=759811 RepID=A0AAQ3F9R6_9BACI|nr:phage tail family protein [Lysinibacillus pakistanensis]MDM5229640.1 phage tail family protein [Lysinibacillus pakistanensis]MDM5231493.1 phage tail family protein [Lysinibacillus pakistanensis]WHY45242.1 phage tail family protein [Lysinibacillus pakistanensis]WHY47040.1 phage tail family protein [Lysinibacillus pakistanensis]WHY50251.1 phage tail family protein [Lysinibacillus pakistanensis]